jgi:predicted phage-related endonuclease
MVKTKKFMEKDDMEDFAELVDEYHNLMEKKKDIEKKTKELKNQIIMKLDDHRMKETFTDNYNVKVSHVKYNKLSSKKIKEELDAREMTEIYEGCQYPVEYDRLSVKERKKSSTF